MAKRLDALYPGKTNPGDADHPSGSFRNETSPVNDDGTPFEQAWANDWLGFFDGLLRDGVVPANGRDDTAIDSQYMQALLKLIGVERAYSTKAEAEASNNVGAERLIILELQDAPFEKITQGDVADEKFEDASGQFWGIPGSSYWSAQKNRWDLARVENIPAVDTLQAGTRSYITSDAVDNLVSLPISDVLSNSTRSYVSSTATTDLENLPLSDTLGGTRSYLSIEGLRNFVIGLRGEGSAIIEKPASLPSSTQLPAAVYPASGRMLVEGSIKAYFNAQADITIDIGDGISYTSRGDSSGNNDYTARAYASRISSGTPGNSVVFTITGTVNPSNSNIRFIEVTGRAIPLP